MKNHRLGFGTRELILTAAFVIGSGIFAAAAPALKGPLPLKAAEKLTREDIEYLQVDAPQASSPDGVIAADDWSAIYPEIAASWKANKSNEMHVSYLEESPYLVNIYEGYGFAKDYESARGHEYCLEDVAATERPHAMANCLTCKTPNFTKLVQDVGHSAYTMDFQEVYAQMRESTSCYNCHGNEAGNGGKLVATHVYVQECLGENAASIDPATLACGQCHIEYYFAPEDKATTMPYHDVAGMTPAAILAYYDELGFSDWVQESTGAHLLKAQHPEMETYLQGPHAALGMNCADCHMPMEISEEGKVYHSHTLVSPLENETLLANCAKCHGDQDMVAFVERIQSQVTQRETEVGTKLSELKDALAAAVADGQMSEEELDAVRKLYREAQWYFDYCYVENAEGAHNSSLANECLDTSEMLIEEAMGLF